MCGREDCDYQRAAGRDADMVLTNNVSMLTNADMVLTFVLQASVKCALRPCAHPHMS